MILTLLLLFGPLPALLALTLRDLYFLVIFIFLLALISIIVYRQLIIFTVLETINDLVELLLQS